MAIKRQPGRGSVRGSGRESGRESGRWGLAVVRGRSMEPGLRERDRLLVRYGDPVRPGVRVLARFADGTLAVKRVAESRETRAGGAGWWLLSDNPAEGVDSRHRGVIPAEAVLAVVRLRVWPPRALRAAWCRIGHIRRTAGSARRKL